jgi:hypothetical protein
MHPLTLVAVGLLSLARLQAAAAQGGAWILWEHASYSRFTAKETFPNTDTWEIHGGFQDVGSCNLKAVSILNARLAFFAANTKEAEHKGEKAKTFVVDSDLDKHSLTVLVDAALLSPPVTGMFTTEIYICLPADFDPREKK